MIKTICFKGGICAVAFLALLVLGVKADNSNTNTPTGNSNTNTNLNTNSDSNSNVCGLSSQTVTGKVVTSQNLGSEEPSSLISQWIASQEEDQGCMNCWGTFQNNLLTKVIEQAGQSNYPLTYKYLINSALYQEGTNAANCMMEGTRGILSCLDGKGSTNQAAWWQSGSEFAPISNEITALRAWLSNNEPSVMVFLDTGYLNNTDLNGNYYVNILANVSALSCSHTNNYNYNFEYRAKQGNDWNLLSNCTAHKCEDIKLIFSPNAEWLAAFTGGKSTKSYHFVFQSPPTPLLPCADQTSCLSQATEYSLTSDTFGKGAQKIPADFIDTTEKSLSSANPYMKCANGVCVTYASGSYPLTATAPASSYFGQCRGFGATINTPEVAVPAVSSNITVNIANQPPVPTVSFAKNPINVNEEVAVTCDIVDPDECSDKIAKVKWACTDSNGQSNNCMLWKEQTGIWNTGTTTQELVVSERSNPFRATAIFKATGSGTYAVTCEAWDDDAMNPLSGTGIAGIEVKSGDVGVVAAQSKYCALLSDSSDTTICDGKGPMKYKAYVSGFTPQSYEWRCSDKQTNPEPSPADKLESITCNYDKVDVYLPSLSIIDGEGDPHECVTQTSTTVANDSKCKVEARKAGSGDNYSASTNIQIGDSIEAKITRQCLKGGKVNWSITDETNDQVKVKINNGGDVPVQASITQDNGQTVVCSDADLNVKEKVQFGN